MLKIYINKDPYAEADFITGLLNILSILLISIPILIGFIVWDWSNGATRLVGLMIVIHILTWIDWRKVWKEMCIKT